jgi:hypothetical protein
MTIGNADDYYMHAFSPLDTKLNKYSRLLSIGYSCYPCLSNKKIEHSVPLALNMKNDSNRHGQGRSNCNINRPVEKFNSFQWKTNFGCQGTSLFS